MRWHYRTILFEFTKDGLLGDKYVDEEEMEKSLNEQGSSGWELVNMVLLQDGLLAFLKREAGEHLVSADEALEDLCAAEEEAAEEHEDEMQTEPLPPPNGRPPFSQPFSMEPRYNQADASDTGYEPEGRRKRLDDDEPDPFGGIRIA